MIVILMINVQIFIIIIITILAIWTTIHFLLLSFILHSIDCTNNHLRLIIIIFQLLNHPLQKFNISLQTLLSLITYLILKTTLLCQTSSTEHSRQQPTPYTQRVTEQHLRTCRQECIHIIPWKHIGCDWQPKECVHDLGAHPDVVDYFTQQRCVWEDQQFLL